VAIGSQSLTATPAGLWRQMRLYAGDPVLPEQSEMGVFLRARSARFAYVSDDAESGSFCISTSADRGCNYPAQLVDCGVTVMTIGLSMIFAGSEAIH